MLPAQIAASLGAVELHLEAVSAAMASGEPAALASASVALRQAAVDLSALLQGVGAAYLKNRNLKAQVKRLAGGIASQRESLLRRSALVEMTLKAVLPLNQSATYGQNTGPYASVGRPFRVIKYLAT